MNTTTSEVTLAWYTRTVAILCTVLGLVALTTTTNQETVTRVLGLDFNLSHGILMIVVGVLGLATLLMGVLPIRTFTMISGIVFTVTGLWATVGGGSVPMLGDINTTTAALHLFMGVTGIVFWQTSEHGVASRIS